MTVELTFGHHQVQVFEETDSLIQGLAAHIYNQASARLSAGKQFHLSLAGGSTPKRLYEWLASERHFTHDLWQTFDIYFGDERYVHHSSADSNYRMVKEAWFDHVSIPAAQIHAIPTDCDDSQDCAMAYQQTLQAMPMKNGLPCFDLVLLGMGDDGHTASLFPGTSALQETGRWVTSVYVEKQASQRITLTYPVLNNAREVILLVTGAGKAEILQKVMTTHDIHYPVQGLSNPAGIMWYVDRDAAKGLL